MPILSSICRELESWSVNDTTIYECSESNFFINIRFLGEISNNWPNDLLGKKYNENTWIFLITNIDNITIY